MAELGRDCARAYVASPVTPETGVFPAIRWAFALDGAVTWSSIGIVVPDPGWEQRLSHLYRMKSRGIRIGTIDQLLSTRDFRGVVIAYRPDAQTLAQTQDVAGAVGVVALAADRLGLQPWVEAYHPVHLGGELIVPAPPSPQSVLIERVLSSFTTRFTTRTGALAAHEVQLLIVVLRQLNRHGCRYTPQGLMATALRVGWLGRTAWELHQMAVTGPPGAPQV